MDPEELHRISLQAKANAILLAIIVVLTHVKR